MLEFIIMRNSSFVLTQILSDLICGEEAIYRKIFFVIA